MAEQMTAVENVEAEQALLRRGKQILEHQESGDHKVARAIRDSIPFQMAMQRLRDRGEEAPPIVSGQSWVCLVLAAAEHAEREAMT